MDSSDFRIAFVFKYNGCTAGEDLSWLEPLEMGQEEELLTFSSVSQDISGARTLFFTASLESCRSIGYVGWDKVSEKGLDLAGL